MEKLCVVTCRIDGLPFIAGETYKIERNPINGKLIIYNVWGYTSITLSELNRYFL